MAGAFVKRFALGAASSIALVAGVANAQDRPPSDPADIVDEKATDIVVTGTR